MTGFTWLSDLKRVTAALSVVMVALAIGCSSEPEVVYVEKEIVKEVPVEKVVVKEVVKEVVVTATPVPAPQPTYTPYPAATPQPRVEPTPTPPRVAQPTPTPVWNDYYVMLIPSAPGGGTGGNIELFADFPSHNYYGAGRGGSKMEYLNPLMSHLLKEGVITAEQNRHYFLGGALKVDLDDLSVVVFKLMYSRGYSGLGRHQSVDIDELVELSAPRMLEEFHLSGNEIKTLLYYFDESMLDSDDGSDGASDESYVRIRDGSLETVVTDDQGNTTRVRIDSVDAEEFLDYLLSQGKITIEQRDAYGDHHELTISLRDAADLFEWAETDSDLYVGIDRDDVDYIREELLPLFKFGD